MLVSLPTAQAYFYGFRSPLVSRRAERVVKRGHHPHTTAPLGCRPLLGPTVYPSGSARHVQRSFSSVVMASASTNAAGKLIKSEVIPVSELTSLCEKALLTLGYDEEEARIKTEVCSGKNDSNNHRLLLVLPLLLFPSDASLMPYTFLIVRVR